MLACKPRVINVKKKKKKGRWKAFVFFFDIKKCSGNLTSMLPFKNVKSAEVSMCHMIPVNGVYVAEILPPVTSNP